MVTTNHETSRGLPARRRPHLYVASVTVAVMVASVGLSFLVPGFHALGRSDLPALVALACGFALSERVSFQMEARNEFVRYSPTDVALAIGILFVSPLGLVIARTVGAGCGIYVLRRPPLMKLFFNLAAFTLETVVAVALFRWAFGAEPTASLLVWLGLLGALFLGLVVGGLLVAAAISIYEGGLGQRIVKELTSAPLFHLPGAVIAASVAVPMLIEPWLGIIALSPMPVVWFVVRSHGALLHRYTDLSGAHDFSREVGNEAEPREIATKAVSQIAENLRAASVALRLWDSDGAPIDVALGHSIALDVLPDGPTDDRWQGVFEAQQPQRLGATGPPEYSRLSDFLAGAGIEDALVAPLADDRGVLGVIVLGDRQGASSAFDGDDASRLSAMTQQLAVALRMGQFHSQIQHETTHDRLTGLPNRAYFEAWIDQATSASVRPRSGVLLIDLDRFKEINDTFGHQVGDLVLVAASDRIRSCCEDADLPARVGGDEFAVFLPGADAAQAAAVAERVTVALELPFELGNATVAIASSIGIAAGPNHGRDGATLLRAADIAMSDAKRRRVRASTFRDDMEENDSVRLALLADLRLALEANQLQVHYQPKLDLRSGLIVSAEALVRWSHPERGAISPEVFVGLAEQAGLIEDLTRQVLGRALASAAEWARRGWAMSVAVNVSAQSLIDEQFVVLVSAQLRRAGVEPEQLTLEITESTMMDDPARTTRVLRGLHELGVKLSVDDFGTGFSSLVNLRHLPVSELKIDRSFVSEMMTENNDDVIVRSTIDLGHNLGLQVVAEGVEHASIQRRLAELGCDMIQGYHISRALPHDRFVHWVTEHNRTWSEVPSVLTIQQVEGSALSFGLDPIAACPPTASPASTISGSSPGLTSSNDSSLSGPSP